MARRVGLSPMGVGRLVVFGGAALIYGVHMLAVKIGLADEAQPHHIAASVTQPESLAQRDAEVKAMIAERKSRAEALSAENDQ